MAHALKWGLWWNVYKDKKVKGVKAAALNLIGCALRGMTEHPYTMEHFYNMCKAGVDKHLAFVIAGCSDRSNAYNRYITGRHGLTFSQSVLCGYLYGVGFNPGPSYCSSKNYTRYSQHLTLFPNLPSSVHNKKWPELINATVDGVNRGPQVVAPTKDCTPKVWNNPFKAPVTVCFDEDKAIEEVKTYGEDLYWSLLKLRVYSEGGDRSLKGMPEEAPEGLKVRFPIMGEDLSPWLKEEVGS